MIKTDKKGNVIACITTKEDLDYTNFDLETIDYYDNFLIPSYEQEIERLNNIINELELLAINEKENKYWGNDSYINGKNEGIEEISNYILDKIKELKGSDKK